MGGNSIKILSKGNNVDMRILLDSRAQKGWQRPPLLLPQATLWSDGQRISSAENIGFSSVERFYRRRGLGMEKEGDSTSHFQCVPAVRHDEVTRNHVVLTFCQSLLPMTYWSNGMFLNRSPFLVWFCSLCSWSMLWSSLMVGIITGPDERWTLMIYRPIWWDYSLI